ncbi:C2 domain-containing protein, partial [Gloeopeniophorella convolvens]
MSTEDILGTLVIVVLKARNLIDNHKFYKQDPYVKLSLGGPTRRTQVEPKGGQHPVWDAELRFPIPRDASKSTRTLDVKVFSEERRDDQLLGEASVDISDILKSGEFDDWVPLSLSGAQRGDVYLEMTFFSAGPAPLTRRPSKFTPSERLARP